MELSATITQIKYAQDGGILIQFRVPPFQVGDAMLEELERLQKYGLDVKVKRHRETRSLGANALLWKCITSMADIMQLPKEEVYAKELRDYGVSEILTAVPEADQKLRRIYADVMPVGRYSFAGKELVEFRCILGSSKYDVDEMRILLNGVIQDCREIGAFVPDERQIMTGLEIWKKQEESATYA